VSLPKRIAAAKLARKHAPRRLIIPYKRKTNVKLKQGLDLFFSFITLK